MKNTFSIALLTWFFMVAFTSCLKKDFDLSPNNTTDPNLPVNISIANLKNLYNEDASFRVPMRINDDYTIYGIVTANDASGNFYQQIIIQDSTAAIAIKIDKTSLDEEFPVGRKIYVKCKGLYLGDYGKFVSLGFTPDANKYLTNVPSTLMVDYIVKATFPNAVPPKVVTIEEINDVSLNKSLVGMLVKIERAQFVSSEIGKTFALVPDSSSGENRKLESCDQHKIDLRTSSYSNFSLTPLPTGSGEITAIYSRFNEGAQLLIRDVRDVNFNQDRCAFGTQNDVLISIDSLRRMYVGAPIILGKLKIRGTVISDRDEKFGKNITSRNLVLQDNDKGIVIRFLANTDNTWAMNDSIEILLNGHVLSEFGKLLQVGDGVLASNVQKLGTGNVTPRLATISNIIDSFERWESTLVTINYAHFVSGANSTYQNTILLNDGSTATNFPLFTQASAEFANVPAPIGETKSVTGFLYSISTANRISIRRLTDIK